MQGTLTHSIEQEERDQRPWISLLEMRDVTVAPNKPIRATLTFSNSGKTVALKVNSGLAVVLDPSNRPLDQIQLAAKAQEANLLYSEGTIFPNVILHSIIASKFVLTEQDYQNVQNGKST